VITGMNVNAARCEALFASALQRSDEPTLIEVRDAIQRAVRELGSRGCAAWVAQEFGDHPETAILRMKWAREAVERAFIERAGLAATANAATSTADTNAVAEYAA
jgi:hypothetical protein